MTTPPKPRESALRFFFTVPSLAVARSLSHGLGGDVALEQWQGPGFVVCDATDPEGNLFHVREVAA
jgi:predicted enzyme related to lactoylglutathione lyase